MSLTNIKKDAQLVIGRSRFLTDTSYTWLDEGTTHWALQLCSDRQIKFVSQVWSLELTVRRLLFVRDQTRFVFRHHRPICISCRDENVGVNSCIPDATQIFFPSGLLSYCLYGRRPLRELSDNLFGVLSMDCCPPWCCDSSSMDSAQHCCHSGFEVVLVVLHCKYFQAQF